MHLQVGLVVYWVAITALLYSAGDLTTNCRSPDDVKPLTFSGLSNYTDAVPPTTSNATMSCYRNMTE